MSDLFTEQRIPVTKLAQQQGVSITTVWRWSLRGSKGHVLEKFNVGGRKFTTVEAFERWLVKINEGKIVAPSYSRRRQREIEAAERYLEKELGPWRSKAK